MIAKVARGGLRLDGKVEINDIIHIVCGNLANIQGVNNWTGRPDTSLDSGLGRSHITCG
jgi:hypothetical protein